MSGLLQNIGAALADRFAEIVLAQSAFFDANGRYAQLLPTHSVIPADGEFRAPDRRTYASEADAITAWDSLGELPEQMQSCLRIDAYGGPRGHGYEVIQQIILGGALWERSVNCGPETERSRDWSMVES